MSDHRPTQWRAIRKIERQARVRFKKTASNTFMGAIILYVCLEVVANIGIFGLAVAPTIDESGVQRIDWSQFNSWKFFANIDDANAGVIVTACLLLVATFNIAAIASDLALSETLAAQLALGRWAKTARGITASAAGVGIAVAATRFPEEPGLAIGLLLVALISLVGADLEVLEAGALRRTSALREYRRDSRRALKRFLGVGGKYPPLLPAAALSSISRPNIRSSSFCLFQLGLIVLVPWLAETVAAVLWTAVNWGWVDLADLGAAAGLFVYLFRFWGGVTLPILCLIVFFVPSIWIARVRGSNWMFFRIIVLLVGIFGWMIMWAVSFVDSRVGEFTAWFSVSTTSVVALAVLLGFQTGWSPTAALPLYVKIRLSTAVVEAEKRYRRSKISKRPAESTSGSNRNTQDVAVPAAPSMANEQVPSERSSRMRQVRSIRFGFVTLTLSTRDRQPGPRTPRDGELAPRAPDPITD